MKTLTRILMVSVLSLFLFVGNALAIATLDFGTGSAGVGGLLTYFPGPPKNMLGVGVPVDVLTVAGTPMAGVYDLTGAFAFNGQTAAVLSFDTRPATNFIQIIGGVPAFGIPNGTVLMSGAFTSFTITQAGNILSLGPATGPDTKDPGLLAALLIDPNTKFDFFGFTISSDYNPTTGGGPALSTDIANTGGKIPEPISLILLGSGLAGVGLVRRFRKSK